MNSALILWKKVQKGFQNNNHNAWINKIVFSRKYILPII